jgi:uncharacterized protein (DUF433 family)
MTFAIQNEPVSLSVDDDEIVRVGASRVALDTIIAAHLRGATPQQIAAQYSGVSLADVYAVVGYYLRHSDVIDAYLEQRRQARRNLLTTSASPAYSAPQTPGRLSPSFFFGIHPAHT